MSDIGLIGPDEDPEREPRPPGQRRSGGPPRSRRRKRGRRGRGCLPALIILLVIVVGGYFALSFGVGKLKERFGDAPDYAGPGSGSVVFKVESGATSSDIARGLKAKSVVKSVGAFTDAANADPASRSIQVGYYQLKKKMKAKDALGVLIDKKNLIQSLVVVPEGARLDQIVKTIAAKTDISAKDVTAALKNPAAIGLPATAKGNPEGYLFPATYTVVPGQTAVGLVRQMVEKTAQVERDLDVASGAEKLGLSPENVLTVASILEYEANQKDDYPKVARVLYNRLKQGIALKLDSTVTYISKRKGDVYTTAEERASTSPYNTYNHTGLPPGPIGSPGTATITAALHPATGNWLYFLPDFEHNKTLFFDTDGPARQKALAELNQYCRTHKSC